MGNRLIKSSLKHYGVKGMKWGVLNEDKIIGDKVKHLPQPYPLAADLPTTKRYDTTIKEYQERVYQELRDDKHNRINNLNDVPRFNPKNESITTALQKINEGYAVQYSLKGDLIKEYNLLDENGKVRTFGNNCPSATFAYELRRRGLDVEAGLTGGSLAADMRKGFLMTELEWKEEVENTLSPPKTREEFEAILKAMGPGARGCFIMSWKSGGGHVCSFEINSKGDIVYVDAQSGVSSEHLIAGRKDPKTYFEDSKQFYAVRLDNRKLDENWIKDWVRLDDRVEPAK